MGLARGIIPAAEHYRFDGPIQFGDGNLEGHLHRVEAQIALLPFLGGLEYQRQRHHVGAIERFQHFHRLGMVLASGPPHQRKTGERYHTINNRQLGIEGVVEEGIHRFGEVEAAAEHGNNRGTSVFHFLDNSHVMGLIAGNDVAALQHQTDHRSPPRLIAEIGATGGPI